MYATVGQSVRLSVPFWHISSGGKLSVTFILAETYSLARITDAPFWVRKVKVQDPVGRLNIRIDDELY